MNLFLKAAVSIFLFVAITSAQQLTREQKLQKITELNRQIKMLEDDVLLPETKDLKIAQKENFNVFRLMPREIYDHKLSVQGGGSFYSFTNRSHDYQKIAQIALEQNNLKVGFAGADYGFIYDLGEVPLASVSKETTEANFLANYKPPTNESEIRAEQRKAHGSEAKGILYKNWVPVVVGHTYLLRSLNFNQSDVLVAFKVHRKDTDGSLIIFWKNIANFDKPRIVRNQTAAVLDSPQDLK